MKQTLAILSAFALIAALTLSASHKTAAGIHATNTALPIPICDPSQTTHCGPR